MAVWAIERKRWSHKPEEGRGGCEFPVWLKAQIVAKGRREAMWVNPGTLGDTRQGCFPYRSLPPSVWMNPFVYWCLLSAFCFAVSCRPRQWDLTSHGCSALKPEPWEDADQQPGGGSNSNLELPLLCYRARSWWPPPCRGRLNHISTLQPLLHTWLGCKRRVEIEVVLMCVYKNYSHPIVILWVLKLF